MRQHTPLMKTVRHWLPLTRELQGLAADGSLELMTLPAHELDALRQQAAELAASLSAWQTTHRPRSCKRHGTADGITSTSATPAAELVPDHPKQGA